MVVNKALRSLRKAVRVADDRALLSTIDRERERARRSFLRWQHDEDRVDVAEGELRDRLKRRPFVLGEVAGARAPKAAPDGS